jgi:hypothetical protein
MPLPRETEQAADRVAARLDRYDVALAVFVAEGGRPPSIRAVLDDIRGAVRAGVEAALSDAADGWTVEVADEAVRVQMAAIETALRRSEREARRARRRVPRGRRPPEPEDDESLAGFARRVGPYVALAALVAGRVKGRRVRSGAQVRDAARTVGARLPRPLSPTAKMIVRTESAIARNRWGADYADREGLVIYVRDARKGPTDEYCERVNGRYATPEWMREHPVEHPNCTRQGRPVRLPSGRRVTLIE